MYLHIHNHLSFFLNANFGIIKLHLIIILSSQILFVFLIPGECDVSSLEFFRNSCVELRLGLNNSSNLQQFLRKNRNQELDFLVHRDYFRSSFWNLISHAIIK